MRVYALLSPDRTKEGVLWATDDTGPIFGRVRCRGKADNQVAAAHDNPERDPTKPFGDHPVGVYLVTGVERDKAPTRAYGPAFILLRPVSGPAWRARENGRAGLAIHGGDLQPDGTSLRATEGCLRIENDAVATLAKMIEAELAAERLTFYEVLEQTA